MLQVTSGAGCTSRLLYGGTVASVADVSCRARASEASTEYEAREHQLVFVRSGAFMKRGSASGARALVADPLHALFLNRGEAYRISHPSDSGDECTVLTFSESAMRDVVAHHRVRGSERLPAADRAPLLPGAIIAFRELRRRMMVSRDGGGSGALGIEERALELLAWTIAGVRATDRRAPSRVSAVTRESRRDLVERAKVVLACSPGRRWTLDAIARVVGSSPYHLTRVFHESAGVPLHRYLVRLRLAVAYDRVERGERNLSALALDLGFSSHSHFTTSFQRVFGVLPSVVSRSGRVASTDVSRFRGRGLGLVA